MNRPEAIPYINKTKREILDHIEFEGLKAASKDEWFQVVHWASLYETIYYDKGYTYLFQKDRR